MIKAGDQQLKLQIIYPIRSQISFMLMDIKTKWNNVDYSPLMILSTTHSFQSKHWIMIKAIWNLNFDIVKAWSLSKVDEFFFVALHNTYLSKAKKNCTSFLHFVLLSSFYLPVSNITTQLHHEIPLSIPCPPPNLT